MKNIKLLTTEEGTCSLQITHIENLQEYNQEIDHIFLIKNLSESPIRLTVILADGNQIETTFSPGWNPELCLGIISGNTDISNIQIGW